MNILKILKTKDTFTVGSLTIAWGWNEPDYKFKLRIWCFNPFTSYTKSQNYPSVGILYVIPYDDNHIFKYGKSKHYCLST